MGPKLLQIWKGSDPTTGTTPPGPPGPPPPPPPPPPPAPHSEFSATPLSGVVPLTVQFTDLSTGKVNSRLWNFGDGHTSTSRNPKHTYTNESDQAFDVSLKVTNSGGSDTMIKPSYIDAIVSQTMEFMPTPGTWSVYGDAGDIDPNLVANKGVVGLLLDLAWNTIHTAEGVFDWSAMDNMVAQSAANGFKVSINYMASHVNTPQWVIDATDPSEIIYLIDPAPNHPTFCTLIPTCLPWSEPFRSARLAMMASCGARYKNNAAVEGYMLQFANHHSSDWNVQDNIYTPTNPLQCPACPQSPPLLCGPQPVPGGDTIDQPAQWLAAGWTEEKFINVGKETLDAAALAFPYQRLKLPMGGLPDPRMADTYASSAKALMDYVYGDPDDGGNGKSYANRVYLQRQVFLASWKPGTFYLLNPPGQNGSNYIRWMIAYRARPDGPFPNRASLQNEFAAISQGPDCLLQGGPDGVCGPTCPKDCVLRATFSLAQTYNVDTLEIVNHDAKDPTLYAACHDYTLAVGGTLRP